MVKELGEENVKPAPLWHCDRTTAPQIGLNLSSEVIAAFPFPAVIDQYFLET
jgi:hypothetical protein